MSKFLNISTDNTLGGNNASNDVVSSQKAVKDYIDAHSGGASISDIFPVGSCYVTIGNTNPNTLLGVGTWSLVTSTIISSVNTSVPVKGTGKTLGLTNGTKTTALSGLAGYSFTYTSPNAFNTNVSTTGSSAAFGGTLGVTTDATKSGIVGTVTRTSLALYIWQRTA